MNVARCGSTTHLRVTHRACPLNPKRAAPDNLSARGDAPPHQKKTQETQVDSDAESHTSVGSEDSEDSEHSEDSEDSDDVVLSKKFPGAVKPFPYAVGTWVEFEFGDKTFAGQVTKLYPGQDLCSVRFTDGDKGDYEADEIQYATELYAYKFRAEEE